MAAVNLSDRLAALDWTPAVWDDPDPDGGADLLGVVLWCVFAVCGIALGIAASVLW